MEEIGASWASNLKILGKFLNFNPNAASINFRDHRFKIIPYPSRNLKAKFPLLKNTSHWKVRYSNCKTFNSNSSSKDIKNVKDVYQMVTPAIATKKKKKH